MFREHSLTEYEQLTKLQNTYELNRRLSFGEKLLITDVGQKTYGKKNLKTKSVLKVWCKSVDGWSETFVKIETPEDEELFNRYLDSVGMGYQEVAVKYDDFRGKLVLTNDETLVQNWFEFICKVWG